MAYYSLEPWGEDLLKLYLAQLTAATINVQRTRRFTKPGDFVLDFHRERPKATLAGARRMEAYFKGLTERMGGRVQ